MAEWAVVRRGQSGYFTLLGFEGEVRTAVRSRFAGGGRFMLRGCMLDDLNSLFRACGGLGAVTFHRGWFVILRSGWGAPGDAALIG